MFPSVAGSWVIKVIEHINILRSDLKFQNKTIALKSIRKHLPLLLKLSPHLLSSCLFFNKYFPRTFYMPCFAFMVADRVHTFLLCWSGQTQSGAYISSSKDFKMFSEPIRDLNLQMASKEMCPSISLNNLAKGNQQNSIKESH